MGQFFIGENDLGRNRGEASLEKIQQLNYYVRVNTMRLDMGLCDNEEDIAKEFGELEKYQVIVLAKWYSNKVLIAWSGFCRKHGIKLIVCSVNGVFSRLINDWGDEFLVTDKNGE